MSPRGAWPTTSRSEEANEANPQRSARVDESHRHPSCLARRRRILGNTAAVGGPADWHSMR